MKSIVKTDLNNVLNRHNNFWNHKGSKHKNTLKRTDVKKTEHKKLPDSIWMMKMKHYRSFECKVAGKAREPGTKELKICFFDK